MKGFRDYVLPLRPHQSTLERKKATHNVKISFSLFENDPIGSFGLFVEQICVCVLC